MQVILFQSVEKLGMQGDVVSVAPGYFRNYLGPRGMAVEATDGNLRQLEMKRKRLKAEAEKQVQAAEGFARQLSQARVEFIEKANIEGRLFGAIHDREIVAALKEQGFELERRQILLPEPIKTVGEHVIRVRLLGTVETTVTIQVTAEAAPAEEEEPDRRPAAEAAAEAEAAEPKAEVSEAEPKPDEKPAGGADS